MLPVTDRLAESGISLPTFSGMRDDEVDRVVDALRDILAQ